MIIQLMLSQLISLMQINYTNAKVSLNIHNPYQNYHEKIHGRIS